MKVEGNTVLVTGANGFVGTRVVRRLLSKGARVRAMARRPGEMESLVQEGAVEVVGDLTDAPTARDAANGVDVIVHCAATAGGEPELIRHINWQGTRSMLEAARAARVSRFVHISTVSVYDFSANPALIDEDALLKSSGDPYGWTKADADKEVLTESRAGLPVVILRPPAILGAHATSTWAVKIPKLIRDGKLPLPADGLNTWSWVHIENLVDAVVLALEEDRATGRIYNVVDGHSMWRAFTDDLRKWFDAPPLRETPREELKPGQYWTGRYAAERIHDELGWIPRRTYAEGMAEGEAAWREGSVF